MPKSLNTAHHQEVVPEMEQSFVQRKWRIIAGAIVYLFTAIQFVVGEWIAASAWVHPPYSYTKNYISDLGVTVCGDKPAKSLNSHFTQAGQILCSPKHGVMNTSFILLGVGFFIGTVLLMPTLSRRRGRAQAVMAAIFAICLTTVGLVHAQSQTGSAIIFHVLGAFVGILLGNVALIRMGLFSRHLGAPRWYGVLAVALGIFGIFSGLLVAVPTPLLTPPVWERGSAYSFVLGLIVTGGLVIYAQVTGRLNWGAESDQVLQPAPLQSQSVA